MKYRFKSNWAGGIIVDENDKPITLGEISDLLNDQHTEITEFVTVLTPIKKLMMKNGFDIEELPKLVESGIENETCHYKELLRIAERIIETHLSKYHNDNYQDIKSRLLLQDMPESHVRNCRCHIPKELFE